MNRPPSLPGPHDLPVKGVVCPILRAVHQPRPVAHDAAFTTALRLLATWAVRAAEHGQPAVATDPASLDFSCPQSDESPCLRDRSGSPTTAGGNQ